jgi:aspartate ammonia-lyase
MKINDIKNFIRKVSLFEELTDGEIQLVSNQFEVRDIKKGDFLYRTNNEREALFIVYKGEVELFTKTSFDEERRITLFTKNEFLGEGALFDTSPHSTSARAVTDTTLLIGKREKFITLFNENGSIAFKVISHISRLMSRRISHSNSRLLNLSAQYFSGKTRIEHDLLGDRDVPDEFYYGVQTLRALENFNITGVTLNFYPEFIKALAMVKMGSAEANLKLGLIDEKIAHAITEACREIINGNLHRHFVVDMIQGGAGTSTNMNANEVIANRALEILGHEKGEYQYCHPNNHVNLSQSTNDAYPTSVKIASIFSTQKLVLVLQNLIQSFRDKAKEFSGVIKMGRTQLQDAVPMTLGQEFEAYAVTLEEEIERLNQNATLFLEINMGATAIGTGINADPEFSEVVVKELRKITGLQLVLAANLIEATQDTGAFIMFSSAIKRLAVKLSKICNDLRLLSSGPRCGLNEINLPPMQPGSSIMPGKVNPVIPEVVNQIAFKVIGNDLSVTLAVEAGQLELNVMEPLIVQSLFESIEMLQSGMETLAYRCVKGIKANVERCRSMVENSIGLVTALNPLLGYETSTMLAKEALEKNRGVYELVLEKKLLSREELDEILKPENMIKSQRRVKKKK